VADNDEFLTDGRIYQHDGLYWKPPGLGSIGFSTQRAGAQASPEELRFLETGLLQFFGIAGWGLDNGGSGVIYKTPAAKALFIKYAAWYKQHRRILNADILHLRRATGRSWDAIGHADPSPPRPGHDPRALFIFFNPTASPVDTQAWLPLYYTGTDRGATVGISWLSGGNSTTTVDMDYLVQLPLKIEPKGVAVVTVV
jgi:hypothetical protein